MDPRILLLNKEATAKEAMTIIDKTKAKIALIINDKKELIGTITDGDIRRSLLREETLDINVQKIMNKNYKFVFESTPKKDALSKMNFEEIKQLPVINSQKQIVDLFLLSELGYQTNYDNPIVIMAGGKGKRLLPLTDNCPKPMLNIGDKPMLELIISKFKTEGFKNFFISVNHMKEQIIDFFKDGKDWDINIEYLIEENPLGTAGSLSLLPSNINLPFLVCNGDVLSGIDPQKLLNFHLENNALGTIGAKEIFFDLPYGTIKTDGINLSSFKEKPSIKNLINAGIYVLDPKLLKYTSKDKFLDMPSLLEKALEKKEKIIVYPIHEYWIDAGIPETFEKVNEDNKKGCIFE